MEIRQLHCINQVFVTPPHHIVPHDICPRVEVASPSKLLAICDPTAWARTTIHNHPFMFQYIPYTETVVSYATTMTLQGFYVATDAPDMFHTVPDLLARAHDPDFLVDWLSKWAHRYFLMTPPVIDGTYAVSCDHQNKQYELVPGAAPADVLNHMINNRSYTLCNGLTLALALVRGRFVPGDVAISAMNTFFNDTAWYAPVPEAFYALYITNLMPQTSEFPFLYVCMGPDSAPMEVIRYLNTQYESCMEHALITGVHHSDHIFYTSCKAAAIPHIRRRDADAFVLQRVTSNLAKIEELLDEDYDYHTLDMGGFLRNIVATRGMWSWWRTHRGDLMDQLLHNYHIAPNIMMTVLLKRLFQIYNDGAYPHGRIRSVWRDVCEYFPPAQLQQWLRKFLNILYYKHTTGTRIWIPEPPVAFYKDVVDRLDLYKRNPDDGTTLIEVMRKFAPMSTTGVFVGLIERRMLTRLCLLSRAACKNDSVWHALSAFMRERPSSLYS